MWMDDRREVISGAPDSKPMQYVELTLSGARGLSFCTDIAQT